MLMVLVRFSPRRLDASVSFVLAGREGPRLTRGRSADANRSVSGLSPVHPGVFL